MPRGTCAWWRANSAVSDRTETRRSAAWPSSYGRRSWYARGGCRRGRPGWRWSVGWRIRSGARNRNGCADRRATSDAARRGRTSVHELDFRRACDRFGRGFPGFLFGDFRLRRLLADRAEEDPAAADIVHGLTRAVSFERVMAA